MNIGVLGTLGYNIYKKPSLITEPRMNTRPLAYISGGLITLFVLEGFTADKYLETPQGQDELRRAEEEGHLLYNRTKEIILRPKVAGGILGVGESDFVFENITGYSRLLKRTSRYFLLLGMRHIYTGTCPSSPAVRSRTCLWAFSPGLACKDGLWSDISRKASPIGTEMEHNNVEIGAGLLRRAKRRIANWNVGVCYI